MTKFTIAAVVLAALSVLESAPAKAEVVYPWCAYYGRFGTQATNCGFTSRQQCLATVSGIGGYCARNPRYPYRAKKRRR
ncbi:MAG: DUF3551 domain-containing protein [Pseudolabrys sp.]|nr:DUF3551 domain-containing protein [Pseudolabrys sp.]